jgi:DNA-binding NarL/FixJ family response regulator
VLEYVVAGKLNKQIAGELSTVEQTVKIHRAHVMQKMSAVRGRTRSIDGTLRNRRSRSVISLGPHSLAIDYLSLRLSLSDK